MNKEKKAIFDAALDEAKKLKIGNYHTEFIAYMVYRNIKHPTEKMDVLAEKAMDYMNKKRKSLKSKVVMPKNWLIFYVDLIWLWM